MYTISERNVNHALPKAIRILAMKGEKISPRGMDTLEYPTPVATTYQKPLERVLFDPIRDANPFFHLMEALWILGGRNDVKFLAQFLPSIANYSDDGETFHGAYGYRLRYAKGFDQFFDAIELLKSDPDSRQAVLQIWDAELDLNIKSKDIPCNDLIFLKVRKGELHMRVCCRSNDAIWGAYGANVVQFSVLLEYLAARVGVKVGTYTQISDSFHVYTDNPKLEPLVGRCMFCEDDPYQDGEVKPYPMVEYPEHFDEDLETFFEGFVTKERYHNPFFWEVAVPMLMVWEKRKQKSLAILACNEIKATDWQKACREWLERRK